MIKNLVTLVVVLSMLMLSSVLLAQDVGPGQGNGNGPGEFIDENGDGFNDLAPDADGDGIPNGLDEDYVRPEDGSGNMHKYGQADDSVKDTTDFGTGLGLGQGHGPGDGTGNNGSGPGDGTGFGPGTGDCQSDSKSTTLQGRGQRGGRR
jgi:hypothetical protein